MSSVEKVVCDFIFYLYLKQLSVHKMAQENCGVVRMEMENVFQHTGLRNREGMLFSEDRREPRRSHAGINQRQP